MRKIGRLWWRFRKSSHNNVMANFSIYFHMQKPTATFLKCLFFLFALDGHRGLVHPIPSRTRIRLRSWPTRELSKPPFPVVLCSAREPGKAVHLYYSNGIINSIFIFLNSLTFLELAPYDLTIKSSFLDFSGCLKPIFSLNLDILSLPVMLRT